MSKLTEIRCFECEGNKWYWINHEDQAPTQEPCDICKGKGKLMYNEEEIKNFFPEFILTDKLTRIRKRQEETKKLCETVPLLKLDINFDEIGYLLSLLEEKDKALEFYADEDSYFRAPRHQLTYIELDNGKKARKALNTSSNNEGETI